MTILEVKNLSINYLTEDGIALQAVEDLSFNLEESRSLGLVGESGCGKTTAMLGLMRLLPATGRIMTGEINYGDADILRIPEQEMRKVRWIKMSLVFQGAMNALNPVRKVGEQVTEPILLHVTSDKKKAKDMASKLFEMVGITQEMAWHYPHQFSGGMRQRAMIAMALACSPKVLITDEPTTALDVMVQAQILDLLKQLQKDLSLSIIMVTHDLGMVAEICDDVLVMYSGRTAEYANVDSIFNEPSHPYTKQLMAALPNIDDPKSKLVSIPGNPPPLDDLPPGCRFEPRCFRKTSICAKINPPVEIIKLGHYVACHHAKD
jgi:peptide/nickel transport system ATP-binding protein